MESRICFSSDATREDHFLARHVGSAPCEIEMMLRVVGAPSLEALGEQILPAQIQSPAPPELPSPLTEEQMLATLRTLAEKNQVLHSCIGLGYHNALMPPVIARNVLANPAWYSSYTPYQAEVAQGRLEALYHFQTLVCELTGLEVANASLLDGATAAAEAMMMAWRSDPEKRTVFFVERGCLPQTIAVLRGRARPLGIEVVVDTQETFLADPARFFGVLLPYPSCQGTVSQWEEVCQQAHLQRTCVVAEADPMALMLLEPPGNWGAQIVVGSMQRFGLPLGLGGPHAGYLACQPQLIRQLPGRLVGLSVDKDGRAVYRLALQTREQHIRREHATSNICTAQVLPAVAAAMFAIYHGPHGLERIARRIKKLTGALHAGLQALGYPVAPSPGFDTVIVPLQAEERRRILARAVSRGFNLRTDDPGFLGISLDEISTPQLVWQLLSLFASSGTLPFTLDDLLEQSQDVFEPELARRERPMQQPVFNLYHSEHEMLRFIHRLAQRDLSLVHAMIPLGSCTMKLTPASAMDALSWPQWSQIHPFAPPEQWRGYHELARELALMLGQITGLPGVSLQPQAGSAGELTGLLVVRAYHQAQGQPERNVCLIPSSAHGTNPASAAMAGLQMVEVACDAEGNISLEDLQHQVREHAGRVAVMMLTYPSTHGVFEENVLLICQTVHEGGGLVYLDGANMNAMAALARPGLWGVDVCHLNLHKTFASPHGGGGPGLGPICVAQPLASFLPSHPLVETGGEQGIDPVGGAPLGNALMLLVPWAYLRMLGGAGLRQASLTAILNANYMATRLSERYPILFTDRCDRVAHEFIVDPRTMCAQVELSVDDIAKRLMDYGFHPPTMHWPVPGTLMIEPTESESKSELDRYCDALLMIAEEIRDVAEGRADHEDNVLGNAPHPVEEVTADRWNHAYSRQQAAYPATWLRMHKHWPACGRIDNTWGDRSLMCSCWTQEQNP